MVDLPKANPDIESLKMWLWATMAILAVLVAIVGYFLSKRDENISSMLANMGKVVNQLERVVSNIELNQSIRQPILDQELANHRKNIEEIQTDVEKIDIRLTTIEAEHKIAYCKFKG